MILKCLGLVTLGVVHLSQPLQYYSVRWNDAQQLKEPVLIDKIPNQLLGASKKKKSEYITCFYCHKFGFTNSQQLTSFMLDLIYALIWFKIIQVLVLIYTHLSSNWRLTTHVPASDRPIVGNLHLVKSKSVAHLYSCNFKQSSLQNKGST